MTNEVSHFGKLMASFCDGVYGLLKICNPTLLLFSVGMTNYLNYLSFRPPTITKSIEWNWHFFQKIHFSEIFHKYGRHCTFSSFAHSSWHSILRAGTLPTIITYFVHIFTKNLLGFSWEIVMTFEHGKGKALWRFSRKISKLWLATQISKFPSLPKIQIVRKITVYGLKLWIFNLEKALATFWLEVWKRAGMQGTKLSVKKLENM